MSVTKFLAVICSFLIIFLLYFLNSLPVRMERDRIELSREVAKSIFSSAGITSEDVKMIDSTIILGGFRLVDSADAEIFSTLLVLVDGAPEKLKSGDLSNFISGRGVIEKAELFRSLATFKVSENSYLAPIPLLTLPSGLVADIGGLRIPIPFGEDSIRDSVSLAESPFGVFFDE